MVYITFSIISLHLKCHKHLIAVRQGAQFHIKIREGATKWWCHTDNGYTNILADIYLSLYFIDYLWLQDREVSHS